MGLFDKKPVDNIKENTAPVKKELAISMQIIRDVQNKLHISTKLEHAVIPSKISVSRIPSPEFFKDRQQLIDEVEFDEAKAEEEARLKAEAEEAERLRLEEEARLKAEEEARLAEEARLKAEAEEAERLRLEEEARLKAEEEARLAEEARLKAEAEEAERLRLEEEARLKAEEEARLAEEARLKTEAEEAERLRLEEEARLKAEEEARLAEEARLKAEAEEAERLRLEEEAKKNAAFKITSITALNAKRPKGKVVAKINEVKSGGLAAQKAAEEKIKEQEEAKKKAILQQKLAAQRAAEKAAEIERFKDAILIGDAKKADPELGKFEIQYSNMQDKPYKLVIKSNTGKVVFETSPIKSKPNELTAIMIKDIIKDGSFSFIKTPQGFAFRILDSRKRLFSASKTFTNLRDAQLAAAAIKKFGLSANYIDDTTL